MVILSVAFPLVADASAAPPIVALAVLSVAFLGSSFGQWLFRRGGSRRPLFSPGDPTRYTRVRSSYAALPLAFGCGVLLAGVVIGGYGDCFGILSPNASRAVIFVCFGLFFGFMAWGAKEFKKPTLSRTPRWLAEQFREDDELRDEVCQGRSMPFE